jgi:arsenite oxidase small subunit
MQRREFVKVCTASAAAACTVPLASLAIADNPSSRPYNRVKLVDKDGAPIKLKTLKSNHNYVFNYPFESTPCFLLNLDKAMGAKVALKTEAGNNYDWPGGVGPKKTLVAYSAICAHKMAYPTDQVSFISFRTMPGKASKQSKVISCCADASVYDPYAGARVISGPAPQPLAAILLEHDPRTDEIWALGTFGGEKFNEFFQKYEFKLTMQLGDKAREKVKGTVRLAELTNYSAQTAQC